MQKYYGHLAIPLQRIHLELTNVCDFNCVFCPKGVMKRARGYMDANLAERLITEIADNGLAEKITFHVMGEPTLHPDFFRILSHAEKNGVHVGLTTNGGTLSGPIGERLLEYHLHQIDVSLQTPDAESFALRKAGRLGFEEYRSGILRFFSAYHRRWSDTRFKFRFLNTRFRKKAVERHIGRVAVISSTNELRKTFRLWADRIYDIVGADTATRAEADERIGGLSALKWNVAEVWPEVYFETYLFEDWGHAFDDEPVRDAWGGYCFGMRDHFAVLWNGDVTLCCVDFDGNTAIGNVRERTLKDVLSSEPLGEILNGFKRYRLVHPYCRRCLGSASFASWVVKPVAAIAGLKLLKPFFYKKIRLY